MGQVATLLPAYTVWGLLILVLLAMATGISHSYHTALPERFQSGMRPVEMNVVEWADCPVTPSQATSANLTLL